MRLLSCITVIGILIFAVAAVYAQTPGKPDASPSEMSKFPPFPPKEVSVHDNAGRIEVYWKPSPLERVVGYRVYRRSDSGYVSLGAVKKPPFVDPSPPYAGKVSYTVTAIDEFNHESSYAKPAALEAARVSKENK